MATKSNTPATAKATKASPFKHITDLSRDDVARKYLAEKSAATRKGIMADVALRCESTTRKRWKNLLEAMMKGDKLRIEAFAAETREARDAAWAKVRAHDAEAKAKAPAKEAAPAKEVTPEEALAAAAKAMGIDPATLAAFHALMK